MRKYSDKVVRLCLFRKSSVETFECYCTELDAVSALNFVRFLGGPVQ